MGITEMGFLAKASSSGATGFPVGIVVFMVVAIALGWLIIAVAMAAQKARIHREADAWMARLKAGRGTARDKAELRQAHADLNSLVPDNPEQKNLKNNRETRGSSLDPIDLLGLGYLSKKNK